MDDAFLDTSWSLHHHPINNASTYRKIFSSTVTQNQLDTFSSRLATYLTTQASQYKDDFDTEDEKLGVFKDCKWIAISRPVSSLSTNNTTNKKSISITIVYQKQTYKVILYSAYLTLIKASPTYTRRILDFLTETFGISLDVLKLQPAFLQSTLAGYITIVTEQITTTSNNASTDNNDNDDDDDAMNLNRLSILKTAISNLRLTISFTGPVAPNLKTIDLDIPHETIDTLLTTTNTTTFSETDQAGSQFLAKLSHYITEQTGLRLPLIPDPNPNLAPSSHDTTNNNTPSLSADDTSSAPTTTTESPAKLSRISTAFWVFSVEGKIKFAAKVLDHTTSRRFEDIIRSAGADILCSIDVEARVRSSTSST